MQAATIVTDGTLSRPRLSAVAPAAMVALFGLVMLWGVGLSDISAVHNAAHDLRHAAGFPCH